MSKRLPPAVYQAGDCYDPIVAGSIDGTDEIPHDKALERASNAHCKFWGEDDLVFVVYCCR